MSSPSEETVSCHKQLPHSRQPDHALWRAGAPLSWGNVAAANDGMSEERSRVASRGDLVGPAGLQVVTRNLDRVLDGRPPSVLSPIVYTPLNATQHPVMTVIPSHGGWWTPIAPSVCASTVPRLPADACPQGGTQVSPTMQPHGWSTMSPRHPCAASGSEATATSRSAAPDACATSSRDALSVRSVAFHDVTGVSAALPARTVSSRGLPTDTVARGLEADRHAQLEPSLNPPSQARPKTGDHARPDARAAHAEDSARASKVTHGIKQRVKHTLILPVSELGKRRPSAEVAPSRSLDAGDRIGGPAAEADYWHRSSLAALSMHTSPDVLHVEHLRTLAVGDECTTPSSFAWAGPLPVRSSSASASDHERRIRPRYDEHALPSTQVLSGSRQDDEHMLGVRLDTVAGGPEATSVAVAGTPVARQVAHRFSAADSLQLNVSTALAPPAGTEWTAQPAALATYSPFSAAAGLVSFGDTTDAWPRWTPTAYAAIAGADETSHQHSQHVQGVEGQPAAVEQALIPEHTAQALQEHLNKPVDHEARLAAMNPGVKHLQHVIQADVHFPVPANYLSLDEWVDGKGVRLSYEAVHVLKTWFASEQNWRNPYPTEEEKAELARMSGLTLVQVANWLRNERKRVWLPLKRQALQGRTGDDALGDMHMSVDMDAAEPRATRARRYAQ